MKFQCEYICTQPYGLTPVAATHIVKIVLRSNSDVRIEANGRTTNAVSISGLLSLLIRNDDMVKVTVNGEDGHDVMKNIEDVISHRPEKKPRAIEAPWMPEPVSA